MAKVPPPRGKGEPPQASATVGNLDKAESLALAPLNFKVPPGFKVEFKTFAAMQGKCMSRVLQEAFAAYKEARK
jgi:hypothetical protein